MGLMDSVIVGKTPKAPRILIYGTEGIGKSTWAANAPKPLFIQAENGLDQIDTSKFPQAKSFDDVMNQLAAVYSEEHDFQTLVIDSLSALEMLIWADVCQKYGVKTIEKVDGGFARGYKIALDWWAKMLEALQAINEKRNMTIILIAHVGTQEVKDPETSTYDRTAPRLHRLAEGMVSQWCDCVLQAKKKFRVQESSDGFGSKRAIATAIGSDGGERVIRTVGNAAVIAKNRYGLPEEMPLDFSVFFDAVAKSCETKKGN